MTRLTSDDIAQKLAEARLYRDQGLTDEAMAVCRQTIEAAGGEDGEPLRELRALAEALAQGAKPADDEPENAPADHYQTCVGLIEAGFHAEALEQLELLAGTGFSPALVHARMGECCLATNNPFKAREHFEKALEAGGTEREERLAIMDRLALAYENTGAVPKAIKILEQMVAIDRGYRHAAQRLNALAQTAQKAGRLYALVQKDLLSMDDIERAKELASQKNSSIEDVLLEDFDIERQALGEALSAFYQCPYVEFNEEEAGAVPACIKEVREGFFRTNTFVPIREDGGTVTVAIDNPHDLARTDNIKSVLKAARLELRVALKDDINKFIDYYFGKYSFVSEDEHGGEGVFEQLELEYDEEPDEPDDAENLQADSVVVQMANKIIEDGILAGASDIHIESQLGTKGIQVRYRVDGECRHYRNIPYQYKRALASRLKILAKLDISERRLPQDGKIKFRTRTGRKIELRVATIPTTGNNEDVVLRILADSSAMPLDKAGLLPHNLTAFKGIIEKPYGLVAVVGPTGSGKTTTLHAALRHVNRPEKKIWTVEDPVEIVQQGLRQVQVENKIGLDFARVLKAFLRADPDIIMVGETRDRETAETVIEASLTGHLVFTTLHTNSAPETVTRLIGMGLDPFTFADALLGILAQRLVKRLCPKCKQPYAPDTLEQTSILEAYGPHPIDPLDPEEVRDITLQKPGKCPACKQSGYKGRLGIHELLTTNDELRYLISKGAPVTEIKVEAMKAGMRTLMQDGVRKAMAGDTSFDYARAACIK